MPKTIWIINQYAGSPYHGMEFRHYYLAKKFVENGHKVHIISGSYSHLYKNLPETTSEEIDGINYTWVKIPKYKNPVSAGRVINMLVFMLKLFALNTNKLEKPDTIIVSSPSPFPILNGYLWAKKYKAQLFFEIRDPWPDVLIELNNMPKYHPFILFMRGFIELGYKKSKNIISLHPNNQFKYIPNGIDLDEMKQIEPLEEHTADQIPKNKFIIGYTGTLGVANALEYLIVAAKMIKDKKDIHFVIVGKGGNKDNLLKQAEGLENITFIDVINKTQIQSMLNLFDVCYIGWKKKKYYEGGVYANKISDYMYSGKPILYSVKTSCNPVELANCGIIVEPESPSAIVDGILELYNMPVEERNQLGENGREFVIKHHGYDVLAQKYMDLFNEGI
ncbi:MAG: hypothetical protein A2Y25_11925 [Candidatus Melainabacteria bacterium GWF2_37_15]|nr:MAG: hypothetical protein A2Y25_11925 [Candidatus Melainabacteria bacterium GWF2_37_15]